MKLSFALLVCIGLLTGFSARQTENVELVCLKTLKASNTCHFNFKIDGMKYHYVDMGCKFTKKKEDLIKKAKESGLALAKEWKLECPNVKKDTTEIK